MSLSTVSGTEDQDSFSVARLDQLPIVLVVDPCPPNGSERPARENECRQSRRDDPGRELPVEIRFVEVHRPRREYGLDPLAEGGVGLAHPELLVPLVVLVRSPLDGHRHLTDAERKRDRCILLAVAADGLAEHGSGTERRVPREGEFGFGREDPNRIAPGAPFLALDKGRLRVVHLRRDPLHLAIAQVAGPAHNGQLVPGVALLGEDVDDVEGMGHM